MTFPTLRQDLRHAVRLWSRSPGLSLAILATLTLSVGAATAVFTFFDVLLLRPLPVPAPHELHAVAPATGASADLNPRYFSLEFYKHLTETDPTFRDLLASSTVVSSGVHLSADESAARIRAELVSGNYFRVLGVSARLGRTISEQDDSSPGAHPVVVLSDGVRAFLFTAGIVTLAGLVFGLVPSQIAARLDLNQVLRRDTVGRHRLFRRLDGQSVLSAIQVALSLVLAIAAALFTRTLHNMRSVETGFQQEHVLLAALDPLKSGYSADRTRILYDQFLTHLRAPATVRAAGLASYG